MAGTLLTPTPFTAAALRLRPPPTSASLRRRPPSISASSPPPNHLQTPATPKSQPPIRSSLLSRISIDEISLEIVYIALPAALALAADPIASLVDTAFVGHLGSVELAAVGVSISVFNLVSKLFNVPLLNVTTSFVAEQQALSANIEAGDEKVNEGSVDRRKFLPAVSTSLALAAGIGVLEAIALSVGSGSLMSLVGIPVDSPMRIPAEQFLTLRAYGAPPIVIALAAQGTFRGFLDTKTPLFAVGGLLIGRTIAVLLTMTLATSLAAREGPVPMAGHQICLQVWLAVSLLNDALALAGQALLANEYTRGSYKQARVIIYRVLQIGAVSGIALGVLLFFGFGAFSNLFTTDMAVLNIAQSGLLFVSVSQPINAIAFVFDGLYYAVSDFAYAAYSMVLVGLVSSVFMLLAAPMYGLGGIWTGLFLFMSLRAIAGFWRFGTKGGPWQFVWSDLEKGMMED